MLRSMLAVAGALSTFVMVAGCGGSGDHTTGPSPDFSVVAATVAPTTLGTVTTINVMVSSTGASGPVTLAVAGAPVTWEVTTPSSATLAANGTATIPVSVTIPTNGDAATGGRTLSITATVASTQHIATTSMTVANEVVVPIAMGAVAGTHWPAFAGTTVHILVGTTLTFRNDDSVRHLIHANGVTGIAHQDPSGFGIASGASLSQTTTQMGEANISCHSDGHSDGFTVAVDPAAG